MITRLIHAIFSIIEKPCVCGFEQYTTCADVSNGEKATRVGRNHLRKSANYVGLPADYCLMFTPLKCFFTDINQQYSEQNLHRTKEQRNIFIFV